AARWYFYENHAEGGISDRALLLQSKPYINPENTTPRVTSDGYFVDPLLFIYDPNVPDPADQAAPETSSRNLKLGPVSAEAAGRIREISAAQNGHQLLAVENIGRDPIGLAYLTPKASIRRLTTTAAVCERVTSNDSKTTETLCKK